MKIELTITKEYDVKYLKASAKVRYWEDATIDGVEDTEGTLTPCRKGDNWEPLIDLDSGKILNWEKGTKADIHFKVCDAGVYQLQDEDRNVIKEIDGYVPAIMCPEGGGYGDYIIMHINEEGLIKNWSADLDDFQAE